MRHERENLACAGLIADRERRRQKRAVNQPNNVCVTQHETLEPGHQGGSHTVFRAVTRYNYSPEPLQPHVDPIGADHATLSGAVADVLAVAHFNKQLTPCCATSLAGRQECRAAQLSVF